MTKEELHDYILENLSLSVCETEYDTIKEIDIVLYFNGDEADRETIQVPNTY